jgi:hypothetical protein
VAYQPYKFDTGTSTAPAPAKSKGGGYQSYFGNKVQQAPSATELSDRRRKRKEEQDLKVKQEEANKPKKTSLLTKVKKTGGEIGSAMIESERAVAKGVSRVLPGSNSDIDANLKLSTEASDRATQVAHDLKSGKIDKKTAQKRLKDETKTTDTAVKVHKSIEKDMPDRGDIALGAAGTAADVITAGTLPELKAGIAGFKTARAARAANVGVRVAANASAGGFNAAAADGDKKEIVKNAAFGAAFPEVLSGGAKIVAKPIQKSAQATKDAKTLLSRQKTQKVLDEAAKVPEPKTMAVAVNEAHVKEGLIKPEVKTVKISDLVIGSEHAGKKIDMAKVKQYEKQIKDGEPIEPIVTHNVNGKTVVVDGQHKLAAAQRLGIVDIPTVEKVPGATPKPPEIAELEASSAKKIAAADKEIAKNDRIFEKKAPDETDEQFAHRYMRENPEQVAKDYADRTRQEFGNTKDNIVSGDEAKFIIPDFGPKKSVPYHEAASAYAKNHYKKLLADKSTKDRPVMIMAGGSGAGKTSSLREVMGPEGNVLDDFAAVVDTNLPDMAGAESRIKAALDSGRNVDINFVYRDPKEAYANGVIPRALRTGRIVPDEIHASTHSGSIKTIQELAEKYKDDPRVDVHVIDNSRGRGNSTVVDEDKVLDFFKNKQYNKEEVRRGAHEALDDAVKNKQLTKEQRDEFISKQTEEASPKDSGTVKREPKQADQKRPVEPKESSTLGPSQTAHMKPLNGYTHSTALVDDYAEMLRGIDKGAEVKTVPDGKGGYKRITEHSRFYREYYREFKKPPTKQDWQDEARRQLEAGTDSFGAGKDYKALLARESQPIPRAAVSAKPAQSTGESLVSKLGSRLEARAVSAKLTKTLGDLPQYSKVNMKEQGQMAAELVANNEQKANRIALGLEEPPANILPESVFTAVQTKALATGDVDMLRQLASSTRIGEATAMGQRLRALAERDPDDAVASIRGIQEARAAGIESRTGKKASELQRAEVKAIKAQKSTVTKETWGSFVESLKC